MGSIIGYGGVGEIGGNKFELALADTTVFLDFGKSYGAEGAFYEEFLQPRSASKLHDLLRLGLLPKLDGLYRHDALRPTGLADGHPSADLWDAGIESFREAPDEQPAAVFVSHAHLDHAGYLPFLGDVPIVCSETTETLLESIPELSSFGGFDDELIHLERREIDELSGGYFPGTKKLDRGEAVPRTTRSAGDGDRVGIGNLDIETFSVGHSIPGSMAALIESDDQQILYTGDLRFHGRTGYDLGDRLDGLRPDVMLCEGTRIHEEEPDDEERVEADLTEVIGETEGLFMVGFAWKDLERYETVRNAALANDRIPVVDPRLAFLRTQLGGDIYDEGAAAFVERSGSMLYSPSDYTRDKYKLGTYNPGEDWAPELPGATEHLEEGYTAVDIRESPSKFVLQLDFYRLKHLVDLDPPPGSTYVRARTEPFNEEMEISEDRLVNWLAHFGINEEIDHEPVQIHASGHAAGPELQAMIEQIEPRTLLPIHTEHPDQFKNSTGEVIVPKAGVRISI